MLPLQSTSSKGGDFSDSENSSAKWWNKSMKEFSSLVTSSKLEKNSSSTNELFLTLWYEHIGIQSHMYVPHNPEVCKLWIYILGIQQPGDCAKFLCANIPWPIEWTKICFLVWLSGVCTVQAIADVYLFVNSSAWVVLISNKLALRPPRVGPCTQEKYSSWKSDYTDVCQKFRRRFCDKCTNPVVYDVVLMPLSVVCSTYNTWGLVGG